MAVTFNVPKSPKRDIIMTDTFMGVDLTNTGVSMDTFRSPHAPNMVRDIPGKVRKRMGYYKEILFGQDINVNYASGTSAEEKQIVISSSEVSTDIKVYDLIQTIKSKDENAYTLYLEFDYKSEDEFTIFGMSVDASEDWTHFSDSIECASTDEFTEIDVNSAVAQEIYIKNFSLLRGKDENYEWSPAPKYFVERETNDPVYGCHFLKNGTDGYDGDRIVNVNRVLKTKDTYDEFTLNSAENFTPIYDLGEFPCNAQKLYIEFDYELTLDTYLSGTSILLCINDITVPTSVVLEETTGMVHISKELAPIAFTLYSASNQIRVYIEDPSTSSTSKLKIKNLSLMYEKDSNYTWSPAPEDNDEKFYLKDMYNIYPKDYSVKDTFEKETNSFNNTISEETTIGTGEPYSGQYQCISFDITTSLVNTDAVLDYVTIDIFHSMSDVQPIITIKSNKNFNKKHFDFFYWEYYPRVTISTVKITFKLTSGNTKAKIFMQDIKIRKFEIRDTFVVSSKWFLYHVGKDFYLRSHDSDNFKIVYSEANEHISQSFQINANSYIIDGKDIYEFSIEDGERLQSIDQDNAYIPVVTIAKSPSGGGTALDAINLLQPGFYEQFVGEASVKDYQLSFKGLDNTECKAWVLDANSNWNLKVENVDFTVNREAGKITFTTAPGASPLTGEDNVKILAYRTVEGYRDRVVKCTFGALFGVNGACDRIFISGNPEHPNWDFYSQYNDATYFPDTGYSTLGSAQSAIKGYAIVSNYLATFKDGFDMSQSVFIREGDLLESGEDDEHKTSEPVFKLINTLQGIGVVSPYAFGYLETEPVFLTKSGIYAITEQDISGEKYSQNRSFYLDGQLRKEKDLQNGMATIYDNQYILALNNKLYVLDGLQATRTDKSEPYATRQYAGFLCLDIPASCIWTDDNVCFGTTDGRVCRFYEDKEALESYNDDGKTIYACWETPDLDDKLFYKNKTFRYFAVRLMQSLKSTVKLYSRKLGVWTRITEKKLITNPIDFGNFDFDLFTFSVDDTERLVHSKVRVKKVDKARFRIENDEYNEPFGLSDLALEYIQSGNYKG